MEKIQEYALVKEVNESTILVTLSRKSACDKCGICGFHEQKDLDITLPNTINAVPGDWVMLEIEQKTLLLGAVIVYGIPFICALVGLLFGFFCLNDIWGLIFCLIGMFLGYIIISGIDKKFAIQKKISIQATEIIQKAGEKDVK